MFPSMGRTDGDTMDRGIRIRCVDPMAVGDLMIVGIVGHDQSRCSGDVAGHHQHPTLLGQDVIFQSGSVGITALPLGAAVGFEPGLGLGDNVHNGV